MCLRIRIDISSQHKERIKEHQAGNKKANNGKPVVLPRSTLARKLFRRGTTSSNPAVVRW